MIEYELAPIEWHGAINTVHNISTLLALWYAEIHHEADDSEIIACFHDLKKRNVDIYKQLQSMRKFMHVNKTMPPFYNKNARRINETCYRNYKKVFGKTYRKTYVFDESLT